MCCVPVVIFAFQTPGPGVHIYPDTQGGAGRRVIMRVFRSARSLNSLLVVLLVAGLSTVAAVILSMMSSRLSRNTDTLLSNHLSTACKALVATMEQRVANVLDAHNATANSLRMDPGFADPTPMAALGHESARQMILGPIQNTLSRMLETVLNSRSFWNLLFYHPNGRVTGFDSAFGANTGLWNYIESTDLYMTGYPMGVPSSHAAQATFGIPWQVAAVCSEPGLPRHVLRNGGLSRAGCLERLGPLRSPHRHLPRSHPAHGRRHTDRPRVHGNATCYSVAPTWNIFWTRSIAEGIGCQVAFDGVWAYNESGALELRDRLTNATIGKNGTWLPAGSYSVADMGAWRFTYQYGSKKFNAYGFNYLPYVGRTRPYFKDKADGGVLDLSVDGDYGWYGPYAVRYDSPHLHRRDVRAYARRFEWDAPRGRAVQLRRCDHLGHGP